MRIGADRLGPLLAVLAIVLLVVPVGGALWLGVAQGESPCILCWAQRTSMLLIALTALFAMRYGPRPRYVGMLVLLGAWGTFMAIRHSSLHLARDVGQGFAAAILGAHTYTWAWVIHWIVLVAGGALLLFVKGPLQGGEAREPGRLGRFAMGLLVVLAGANALQAFVSTGPPPFVGQADPIRLSPNPSRWVWSLGELQGDVSWRGSWAIEEPDATAADPDPTGGPLAGLPTLEPMRWERIAAPVDGPVAGLAFSPGGEGAGEGGMAVVVTEDHGVYFVDPTLSRVLHRIVLDPAFSVQLTPLAGATFVGGDTVAVTATNKSYVLLNPDPGADEELEWRHFLESDGGVSELRRSRFSTVRARQMYVSALAYDRDAREFVTVGVPSLHHPGAVVSRFDGSDFVLSSEFPLRAGPGLALAGPERDVGEYRVTGAAVADGRLYAVSAAWSTLLVVDLERRLLTAAYAVPELAVPVGLAVRGGELWVVQRDGRVAVFSRPGGDRGEG